MKVRLVWYPGMDMLDAQHMLDPLVAQRKQLVQRGVKLLEAGDTRKPALILAHHIYVPGLVARPGPPIVMVERADSAALRWRHSAAHPRVLRVIKLARLRNWQDNDLCNGRTPLHHPPPDSRLPVMTEELANKVKVGWSYGSYTQMAPLVPRSVSFTEPRSLDFNFIGLVCYDNPALTDHRHRCVQALLRYAVVSRRPHRISPVSYNPAGRVALRKYHDSLLDSRVVVSPWGHGEVCYRDFEAWLTGAVLVKPDTSFVETWPLSYEPGITYMPCRLDFADVGDVIESVLQDWDNWHDRRAACRAKICETWQPGVLADHIASLLTDLA